MQHENKTFFIPDIRNFIPEKIKPWILVVFVIVYQLSGGIYLASVSEMTGSMALMQEDIMMAGYASLVGLALTFTFMYRLKFRFPIKTSLLVTALGLIACNLISMHTHSLPLLVAVSFVAGFLRMWGTFACNTTIMLWITPKRDMSVWFVYIYFLVQTSILLSGLTTVYVSYLHTWKYMHWLVVGLLLLVMSVTIVTFRNYRSMKKLPLYGIDWMGLFLWSATILSIIFVLNYGEYLDWFQSGYIRLGVVFGVVSLALNLWRASFIRHPFIELKTWSYRNVWLTFILYILVDLLLSPAHLFEHIYTEGVLGYDALNAISLNWVVILGFVAGTLFTYHVFALRKWKYKTMTLIGFLLIIGYLLVMYFIIDFNLPKEMLILPLFLRGMGYIIIAITFITALVPVPFQNFFQSLTIQAFASACIGALLGTTILSRAFKLIMKKNFMLLSANLDHVNPIIKQIPQGELLGVLQQQSIMVSLKEIYGWLCLLGLFCLLVFSLKESSLRPKALHPKFKTMRKAINHQLKKDSLSE